MNCAAFSSIGFKAWYTCGTDAVHIPNKFPLFPLTPELNSVNRYFSIFFKKQFVSSASNTKYIRTNVIIPCIEIQLSIAIAYDV